MIEKNIVNDWVLEADKKLDYYKKSIAVLHVDRINVNIFNDCIVKINETKQSLKQIANLSIIDNSTIEIKPWDESIIRQVDASLQLFKKDLPNFITSIDKTRILCKFDMCLTQEKRKEICKLLKKRTEENKLALKNWRHTKLHDLKEKKLSEDDHRSYQKKLQEIVDNVTKNMDKIHEEKEKQILHD